MLWKIVDICGFVHSLNARDFCSFLYKYLMIKLELKFGLPRSSIETPGLRPIESREVCHRDLRISKKTWSAIEIHRYLRSVIETQLGLP